MYDHIMTMNHFYMKRKSKIFTLQVLLLQIFTISLLAQPMDPVSWSFSSEAVGNNEFELVYKAKIAHPWHLYSAYLPKGGPIASKAYYNEASDYQLVGDIVEVTKAKITYDEGFQMDVGTIEGKAELRQKVKIAAGSTVTISGEIEYQVCDDANCLPPTLKEFSITLVGEKIAVEVGTVQNETTQADEQTAEGQELSNSEASDDAGEAMEEQVQETETATLIFDATDEDAEKSLWRFFWIAFGAGLLAILTPCVFPMIPMTVSFFMQGSNNRGRAILRGMIFGVSIMAIYTLLGVIVSLTGMDPNTANFLSTNPILNFVFFALFIFFAFSFFGMYELVLPSKWVNKADAGADKGGLAGAFFMALTTVLVSFSCTGPIVGTLLVEAATGGLALKPILGMFGFGLAFAIPFTIFALFPSLLKELPKSGGWLNAVKVVLGFVVLIFSMKFLQPLDPTQKVLTRELVLIIWTILFFMMGMYLMGKLKFAHDSDLPYLSVPRLLLSLTAFAFAIYMFTGIFGAPLKAVSPLLPPKSIGWIDLTATGGGAAMVVHPETDCAPQKYTDMFHMPYNLTAYYDLEEGLACAKELGKPVFVDFKGHFCSNCKKMEASVWSDPVVQALLRDEFVIIALYTDDRTKLPEEEWYISEVDGKEKKTIGQQNIDYEITNFQTNTVPLYVIMNSSGEVVNKPKGTDLDIASYTAWMKEGLKLAE
jgi:thiol:disulfide interchange protein